MTNVTNTLEMLFKFISPGTFVMGSPESEKGRSDDEAQRSVTIAAAFSLGVYPVTQSQYKEVMGDNPSWSEGANYPVDDVSWEDAVAFCKKLSALPAERAAGRVYRLPTEAEWEYSCRAGTTTAYSFGKTSRNLGEYAWFDGNSEVTAHAVGEKLPNGWGLYDMHGNVWEWCLDEVVGGSNRVLRGGSWTQGAAYCRTASRDSFGPSHNFSDGGFRLALSYL